MRMPEINRGLVLQVTEGVGPIYGRFFSSDANTTSTFREMTGDDVVSHLTEKPIEYLQRELTIQGTPNNLRLIKDSPRSSKALSNYLSVCDTLIQITTRRKPTREEVEKNIDPSDFGIEPEK